MKRKHSNIITFMWDILDYSLPVAFNVFIEVAAISEVEEADEEDR